MSISAITESESVHLNLVVVAATGIRFYFSCTSVANPTTRPQGLQLIHVRLPPRYAANATVMRPRKVQMAHYRKGIYMNTLLLTLLLFNKIKNAQKMNCLRVRRVD